MSHPAAVRRIALPGARTVEIRPVGPEDVDGLEALYAGLSAEDRRRRFFSYYRPDRAFFVRLADVSARGGFGLVAEVTGDPEESGGGEPGALVAQAGYELLEDGSGDLAIVVAEAWRGWLGTLMLDALLEAAADRDVPNLECDVLRANRPMLALLQARGHVLVPDDDWEVLHAVIGTRGHVPTWSDRHDRPRVLVEAPAGYWSAARRAEAAGLDVLLCAGPSSRAQHRRCPALSGAACPLAAAADVIVISHPRDDEAWQALVEHHRVLHPGVPICVEAAAGLSAPVGAMELAPGADPGTVADIVADLARTHAGRSDLWLGEPRRSSRSARSSRSGSSDRPGGSARRPAPDPAAPTCGNPCTW